MSTDALINSYFNLEEYRNNSAIKNNITKFTRLYEKNHKIPNLNTNIFWNNHNFTTPEVTKLNNPIAYDRHSIIKNLLPPAPCKVLNVGFGHCELEKIINNEFLKNYSWHGLDISDRSVKYANQQYSGKFTKGLVTKMPYSSSFYDCVIVSELLEHLYPWQCISAIKEINRVLRLNGILIVSVPVNENLKEMVIGKNNINGHLRAYTYNILKLELELNGFTLINKWELFAFKNCYKFKTLIAKFFRTHKANNIILYLQKDANTSHFK